MMIRLYRLQDGKRLYAKGITVDPQWGELTKYDLTDKREEAETMERGDYFHKAYLKSYACRKGLLKEEEEGDYPKEAEPTEPAPKPEAFLLMYEGFYVEEGSISVAVYGDGRKPDYRYRLTLDPSKAARLSAVEKDRVRHFPLSFRAVAVTGQE